MITGLYIATLIGTLLVLSATFSSLLTRRFGAPLLFVFLAIGLIAGVDGLGIDFDDANVAFYVGSLALAVILFDAGFNTSLAAFRQAALPALTLASLGVVLTAIIFGIACFLVTPLGLVESLLLGAIVSSTDAAAVFFLLRGAGVRLRDKVGTTIEIESGTNDPVAIFLTLALVGLLTGQGAADGGEIAADFILGFLTQMGIGAVAGVAGGLAIGRLAERLQLDSGLMPIFVLALSLLVFGVTGALGGSAFLAVYLAGLVGGNSGITQTTGLRRFQDGMSWLAQIVMFLVLGLFATPTEFPAILVPAIALGLILIFVARPLAVSLCLVPFRFAPEETAYVSWVGLRGAVSILLALLPLIAGFENGRAMFNIAFIVVLVSLVVQGWTVRPLARRLGVLVPPRAGPLDKVELSLPGAASHELLVYRVAPGSPVERGERIPRWARPSLVVREGRTLTMQYAGRLREGDSVYIFMPVRHARLLDRLFASRAELDPDDEEFFGTFAIDPRRPAADLAAAYELGLGDDETDLTVAELVTARLGGRAEYGDRAILGEVELIVRDTDENSGIASLGLALERKPPARIPVYLRIADGLRALFARLRRRRPDRRDADGADADFADR